MFKTSKAISLLLLALIGALTVSATAVPVVYSAVVNTSNNQLAISGNNFSPTGVGPRVTLAQTGLSLVSFTNRSIVAQLPTGLAAGSYSLIVTNNAKQTGSFNVTIGAVGPSTRKIALAQWYSANQAASFAVGGNPQFVSFDGVVRVGERIQDRSFRHTFGMCLGETGADAFTIMRLMGHSSVTVSQRYVHPSPEPVERAISRMEAYNISEVQGVGTNLGTVDLENLAVKSKVV